MSYLEIDDLSVHYGKTMALDRFSLRMERDELVVVLGPSGSGKSTLLHAICGLVAPVSGLIHLAGRRTDHLPPGKRRIAMVFQDGALFPHLSVRGNIELPLKASHTPREKRRKLVTQVAELLEIKGILDRRPNEISGGERRRAAMARALVREPDIFLLDEPFASLDPLLRHKMAQELLELHRRLRIPMVHVTHDQGEALGLATKLVVIKEGRIQQVGSPEEVYQEPTNVFVAGFVGYPPMNIFPVSQVPTGILRDRFAVDCGSFAESDILVGFRPEDVHIEPDGDAELVLRQVQGHEQMALFRLGEIRITVRLKRGKPLLQGERYKLSVPHGPVHLFDAATGVRVAQE